MAFKVVQKILVLYAINIHAFTDAQPMYLQENSIYSCWCLYILWLCVVLKCWVALEKLILKTKSTCTLTFNQPQLSVILKQSFDESLVTFLTIIANKTFF